MTDTNYRININNLYLKDPENITMPLETAANKYKFTIGTKTHTKKEYDITRTIYHSKTSTHLDTSVTQQKIIPIWELAATSANTNITIGRIVVNITFNTANADNSTKHKMLRLVGSIPSNSTISSSLTQTSDTDIGSDLLGTNANIYKSYFYIKGRNITASGTTYKYIIDLNKGFNAPDTKIYALGLEVNEVPSVSSKITLDTYVELVN